MTIQQAKLFAKNILTSSPSPELDAEVLLSHVTGLTKTELLFGRDRTLSSEQETKFKEYVGRRITGLPVAYITGYKEFFGYDFFVNTDVLIPKPDTEILVQEALSVLEEKIAKKKNLLLCDIFTGSGCVGLSLFKAALEKNLFTKEDAPTLVLADISRKALDTARKNAEHLLPYFYKTNIQFVQTNIFENISESFDIITANPPYIPAKEARELLKDGRSEPLLALDGDVTLSGESSGENDGLTIMRNFIPQAVNHLNPHAFILTEAGEYNAEETVRIFIKHGLKSTCIVRDLEGQLRVVKGARI